MSTNLRLTVHTIIERRDLLILIPFFSMRSFHKTNFNFTVDSKREKSILQFLFQKRYILPKPQNTKIRFFLLIHWPRQKKFMENILIFLKTENKTIEMTNRVHKIISKKSIEKHNEKNTVQLKIDHIT